MEKSELEILNKLIREKPECVVSMKEGKPVGVTLSFKIKEGIWREYFFHGSVKELKNERFLIEAGSGNSKN